MSEPERTSPDYEAHAGREALRRLEGALLGVARERAADLALAGAAALAGGKAALRHYGKEALAVDRKAGGSPVTEADHASNRAVLSVLAEQGRGDPVLSEESGGPGAGTGSAGEVSGPGAGPPPRLWIVDPLDGTKEFLARNGEFSVMVGLAERGAAVLGAVHQPEPDLLYLGAVGVGAWVVAGARVVAGAQQEPLRPLRVEPRREGPVRFVRSRSHGDPKLDRLQEALGDVEVVRSGSVGIKCAVIAAGRGDLYVHPVPYLKEWDTCAPEAVLRGAGGWVTDCAGAPLRYGKPEPRQAAGICAAVPGLWERVAPLLREVWPEL